MELHINDLSFQEDFDVEDKEKMIVDFLEICDRTTHYYLEKIVVPSDYMQRSIARDFTFTSSFFQVPNTEVDENTSTHSRISSLFANRFKVMQPYGDDKLLYWIQWEEKESDFLKMATVINCPVLSFRTHQDFQNSSFNVDKFVLDSDANQTQSAEIVKNISERGHFEDHNVILSDWKLKQAALNSKWSPLSEPFRFINEIEDYLTGINYTDKIQNVDGNERVSLARTIGRRIAEMSGWQYHGELSRKNDRTVFKALNNSVYLALDTETVSFELHDRHGIHKGEYNFHGVLIEDPKGHRLTVR
jgi:hypothetical protein